MRLALISPKSSFLSKISDFQEFYNSSQTFSSYRKNWSGLGTGLLVVAALTPSSYEIEIIDENIEPLDYDTDLDLVGISLMTHQATRAYQIADSYRERGVPVVLGGLHATLLPEEAIQHADSVVVGEAEILWPRLIRDFEAGSLAPFYRSSGPVDLRESPVPRYDLISSKRYSRVWIQTTRGCPHDCEFCACSTVFGDSYRHKATDQVIAELRVIRDTFEDVSIGFADDNMLANRSYSRELMERLIPLDIEWVTQTDISLARDEKLLELVGKSGCVHLFIGFESVSRDSLQGIDARDWKIRQLERYPDYISRIQSHGIGVMGAFILGLDRDDSSVFDQTAEFIISNNLYDTQVSILTPFPGTRLRERLQREGRLLPTEWENYTVFDVNFIHPRLTREQLENGLVDIYRKINAEEIYARRLLHFKNIYREIERKRLAIESPEI